MDNVLFIIMFVFFLVIFGFTLFIVINSMKRAKINSKLPRITTNAKVVSHRKVQNTHGLSFYFMVFKFDSGDEYEYQVSSDAYAYFVDGDEGKLTIRGTEFISFVI